MDHCGSRQHFSMRVYFFLSDLPWLMFGLRHFAFICLTLTASGDNFLRTDLTHFIWGGDIVVYKKGDVIFIIWRFLRSMNEMKNYDTRRKVIDVKKKLLINY